MTCRGRRTIAPAIGASWRPTRRMESNDNGVRTAELADHVASLPRARIEELMGFTVHDAGSEKNRADGVNLLASVTAAQLTGLHQLAAIGHPVPRELCERLLPGVTDWRALWP